MNNKNTIAAFSIVEAIVGMAVTAIIIGIVFVIFSIITERMLDYKNQNELINDLNRLSYSLNKDIFDNEKMSSYDNEIIFKGYSGESVNYNFSKEFTTRTKESFSDTFKIKLKKMLLDSVKSQTQKKIFLKLKLHIDINNIESELNFYKQVYPNELIQKRGH
jgi:type II secretory pathway component PulJ